MTPLQLLLWIQGLPQRALDGSKRDGCLQNPDEKAAETRKSVARQEIRKREHQDSQRGLAVTFIVRPDGKGVKA